jgi:protein-S-isoprenylcysteine O-methyltransferase Ste14
VSILWLLLALASIRVEENELRARLGGTYAAYAGRVPALLPLRLVSRSRHVSRR